MSSKMSTGRRDNGEICQRNWCAVLMLFSIVWIGLLSHPINNSNITIVHRSKSPITWLPLSGLPSTPISTPISTPKSDQNERVHRYNYCHGMHDFTGSEETLSSIHWKVDNYYNDTMTGRTGSSLKARGGNAGRGNGAAGRGNQSKPRVKTLSDYVYTLGTARQVTDYEVTTAYLCNHITKTFEYGSDVSLALETLTQKNFSAHKPTLSISSASDSDQKAAENRQYEIEFKADYDVTPQQYTGDSAVVAANIIHSVNTKGISTKQMCFLQTYSLKQGLKKFGKDGYNAAFKEMRQLDERDVFRPVDVSTLSVTERKRAMESLIFLTEKRDGRIKARTCANGSTEIMNL